MKTIAIIGAGAAGLMAAATILESDDRDIRVLLFEKNRVLGRKVMISGGGRCNVTSGVFDVKRLLENYPRGKRFLRYSFYEFGPKEIYNWFERQGVKLKIEKDLRVFPVSDNGKDVVGVFEKIFEEDERIEVVYGLGVEKVEKAGGKFVVSGGEREWKADKVVFATGGQAYRFTGSSGDGYSFAEGFGHSVSDLAPSLNSFVLKEDWIKGCSGTSVANSKLSALGESFGGPIIFTHKGVSGPAVFALSSLIAFKDYGEKSPAELRIDLLPEMKQEELRAKIKKVCDGNKKSLGNLFGFLVTKAFMGALLRENGFDLEKKGGEISKKEVNRLVDLLKNGRFTIIGKGAGDEFVTAGGINLKEVDSKTMQSKLCEGVYFVGELLNVDGFTGGFNLSASWATGRMCGVGVCEVKP